MAARNKTRAARRIKERTKRNLETREAAAEIAEHRPKRRYARSRSQLERLEARGLISPDQRRAAERLERDYRASMTLPARLVGSYEANLPRHPKRHQAPPDTLRAIIAPERYDRAIKAVGRWLSPILIHVVICDLPATDWARANGRPTTDGMALLRAALGALTWCHGSGSRREAA